MGFHFVVTDVRSIEAAKFRQAMRNLASGVAIVATGVGATRRGLTVSSVTSLCMDPPCLLVGIKTSETHDAILANGRFGISLLGSEQQDLALHFAGQGPRTVLDGVLGSGHARRAPARQRHRGDGIIISWLARTASSSGGSGRPEEATAIRWSISRARCAPCCMRDRGGTKGPNHVIPSNRVGAPAS